MPLQRCTEGGKSGWRWGSAGKCYVGPGAREKALRQARAIEASAMGLVPLELELCPFPEEDDADDEDQEPETPA